MEMEMEMCVTCKYGEVCTKYPNKIHCTIHNVSFTKVSKCTKWEAEDGKKDV